MSPFDPIETRTNSDDTTAERNSQETQAPASDTAHQPGDPALAATEQSAAKEAEAEILARLKRLEEDHEEELAAEEAAREDEQAVDNASSADDDDEEDDLAIDQSATPANEQEVGGSASSTGGEFETSYLSMSDEPLFPEVTSVDDGFSTSAGNSGIGSILDATDSSGGFGWLSSLAVVGGLAAVGGIAAAVSSSSSGSSSSTTSPSSGENIVTGTAVLGPVTGGVSVIVYDEDGNEIGSGEVTEAGQYRINVGSYSGPVLMQLVDTNAGGTNYVDEAQGAPTDLTVDLRAMSVVESGETVVNITPLTELAVREIGLGSTSQTSLASVSATPQQISNANSALGALFLGDGSLSVEKSEIAAVIDRNGNDTTASANTYGKVLAALSGADLNPGIAGGAGTENTLAALSNGITNVSSGANATWTQQSGEGVAARAIVEAGLKETNELSGLAAIEDSFLDEAGIRTNNAPVSTELTDQSGVNYQAFEYDVSASFSDPDDGDTLTYTASGLPDGLAIDSTTGVISGKLGPSETIEITVTATDDGGLTTSQSFSVSVSAALTIKEMGSDVFLAKSGDSVELGVVLSELVTITAGSETPEIILSINGETVTATYSQQGTGPDANILFFTMTAPVGDGNDISLISIDLKDMTVTGDQSGEGWDTNVTGQTTDELTIDNTAPTLQITSDKDPVLFDDPATLTFTFSEKPASFSDSDISVSGGAISNLQVDAQNPAIYTATFTPDADSEGTATVSVSSFSDVVGNTNASAASLDIGFDTDVPEITDIDLDLLLSKVTITFSEAPVGLSLDDFTASGGTLSNLQVDPGNDKIYTATFTEDTAWTGRFSVTVGADSYQDDAGNDGEEGSTPGLSVNVPTANGLVGSDIADALNISGTVTNGSDGDMSGGAVGFVIISQSSGSQVLPVSGSYQGSISNKAWSRAVNVSGLADGKYNIQATATDGEGNSVIKAVAEFELDQTINDPVTTSPPTEVQDSSFDAEGNLTLSGTMDSDVEKVTVTWDDQDAGTTSDPSKDATVENGTWTVTFTKAELAGNLADGTSVEFKVEAEDGAGNTAESTTSNITLELENLAPQSNTAQTIDTQIVLTETVAGTEILDLTDLEGDSSDKAAFTDQDAGTNGQLTYSSTNLPGWLELTSGGIIRVAAGEAAPSSASNLTITVTATDGGNLSVSRDIDINLVAAPSVTSLKTNDADTYLQSGDTFNIILVMSEDVSVTGIPQIELNINGQSVTASFVEKEQSNEIKFEATAPSADGTSITLASINLNGGSVTGGVSSQQWDTTSTGQTTSVFTIDNTAPSITTSALDVDENATTISTLAATDALDTDLEWTLVSGTGSDDNADFNLATDGTLTLGSAKNYETDSGTYSIRVQATDDAGNSSEQAITVTLNDVNEAPAASTEVIDTQSVLASAASGTAILDLTDIAGDGSNNVAFTDEDAGSNGQLTYSSTDLPDWLEVTSAGVIQIASGQSAPASATSQTITVTATDGGGLTTTRDIDVDVVVAPTLSSNVNGVGNLDVQSDLSLTASENVALTTAPNTTYDIRIVNDANGSGKDGYRTETDANTQTITVSVDGSGAATTSGGSVTIVNGDTIIINPDKDLDLSNNYHIEVDAGLFVGSSSGLGNAAIADTSISFSTVTPGRNASASSTTVADGAVAQTVNDTDGSVADYRYWIDVEGVGDATEGATNSDVSIGSLDTDGKSYVLVAKDYGDGDVFRLHDTNVSFDDFGQNDFVYIDDQDFAGDDGDVLVQSIVPNTAGSVISFSTATGHNGAFFQFDGVRFNGYSVNTFPNEALWSALGYADDTYGGNGAPILVG